LRLILGARRILAHARRSACKPSIGRAVVAERMSQDSTEKADHARARARAGERRASFLTTSGIELLPLYGGAPDGGMPGAYPFTRGVRPSMYRGQLWTMRQYAGISSARETNRRFKHLLESGQTGLSI